MNLTLYHLLHQTACGAIAAAGFGVLFNVRLSMLPWCAASGALTLAVRTVCHEGAGWNLEASCFCAALAAGVVVQWLRWLHPDFSQNAFDVVGCIPMIPGSFATKAILGFYALTSGASNDAETLIIAMQNSLRVSFIIGAIGTGLVIPTLLLRARLFR